MAGWLTKRVRGLPILVVATLLIGTVLVPGVVVETAAQGSQPETDNTVTRITISPNGSAEWTVQVRTRLDTDESVREYEAFQERIRANSTVYLEPFRERMRGVVARAANATGREMRAEEFAIETSIQEVPRRWGIVTFRFDWTNFAASSEERLTVGDVFQGGFFLASNDSLVIRSPPRYMITDVSPPPSERVNGSVTWVGREDFADERPRVEFVPGQDQEAGDGSSTSSEAPDGFAGLWIVIGGFLIVLVGIAVYVGYQRRGGGSVQPMSPDGQPLQAEDASHLTDEERVLHLLEESDGRVRQAEIADAFDWSASKTSRVIGSLVETGDIEKLQLGRENLIDLVEDDTE